MAHGKKYSTVYAGNKEPMKHKVFEEIEKFDAWV